MQQPSLWRTGDKHYVVVSSENEYKALFLLFDLGIYGHIFSCFFYKGLFENPVLVFL